MYKFLSDNDPAMTLLNNAAMYFSDAGDLDHITGEGVEEAAAVLGVLLVQGYTYDNQVWLYQMPTGEYVNAWVGSPAGINGFDGESKHWDGLLNEANEG